jgi:hypothetical protein
MPLVIRRASVHRPGHWGDDDYDVVSGELVIGRVYRIEIARGETGWRWHLHAISGAATIDVKAGLSRAFADHVLELASGFRLLSHRLALDSGSVARAIRRTHCFAAMADSRRRHDPPLGFALAPFRGKP